MHSRRDCGLLHGMRKALLIAALAALGVGATASADAAPSRKKAIWGPVQVDGVSQFPIYADLGVGLFQYALAWDSVAPTKPRRAADPADAAYRWPADLDVAVAEARRYGIRISLTLTRAPAWANGGRSANWAPRRPRDFARFATAAARRYRGVRHWMIWGEPSRQANFRPLPRFEATGPRRYARILDAAYGALKRVRRSNLVIGGNTFTTGDVSPRQFIRSMRLPNGRRPRLDMYGHNPFTLRAPSLSKRPLGFGYADFSDLDTLAAWLDRYGYRTPRGHRPRLFLSEFTLPSDHPNYEFNFWVTREVQARWLGRALRIVRRWDRIYTLGWIGLYDEPPNGPNGTHGNDVHRGLLDWEGRKKPAYEAFRRG
jgi:hypothetical protein